MNDGDVSRVFLITVDDLRADHLGCMGYKKNITPNLDVFAKENISFSQAIATGPMTPLSFPGILYGLYSSEYYSGGFRYKRSLASELKKEGYKTNAFNSNPHFKLWGLSKGFELFEDFLSSTKTQRGKKSEKMKQGIVDIFGKDSWIVKNLWKLLTHFSANISLPYADAETMNKTFFNWAKNNKFERFFCWIHYMDPHYPFLPPMQYLDEKISKKRMLNLNRKQRIAKRYKESINERDRTDLVKLYDAEIKYFDEKFGELVNFLKKMNLYDDSLIVFTSDHGELFGDYGRYGHEYDVLYQKQLHAPLMIKTPSKIKNIINRPASLIDIPHTICDFAVNNSVYFKGGNLIESKGEKVISEGFKLSPIISGKEQKSIDDMVSSVQYDKWKLIMNDYEDDYNLFDLETDPHESNDVSKENWDVAKNLIDELNQHKQLNLNAEQKLIENGIQQLKKDGKI